MRQDEKKEQKRTLDDRLSRRLIYGGIDTQVGVETADHFVEALGRAGAKDVHYYRLGNVDHCPYTTVRVPWLIAAVNEFFQRTLELDE